MTATLPIPPAPWEAITENDVDPEEFKTVSRLLLDPFIFMYRYPFEFAEEMLRLAEKLNLIYIKYRGDYLKYFYLGQTTKNNTHVSIIRHEFKTETRELNLGIYGSYRTMSSSDIVIPRVVFGIDDLEQILLPLKKISDTSTGATLLEL